MGPRLEKRPRPSTWMVYGSPVLAVLTTVAAGTVLFAIMGFDPLQGLHTFFVAPINNAYGLAELGVKATPLVLIGVGLAVGFRANVWNIGAEGQLTMGAVAGGGVALWLIDSESAWVLPTMVLAGTLGGCAWAAIPAFLKTRFNANEILTSLMLTYVAALFLSYLVHGPWKDPAGYNFPETQLFSDAATLPIIMEDTRLHVGALFALAAMAAVWLMFSRAMIGFQVRVAGLAPAAARYAGFNAKALIWFCLMVSGGLAGLAGLLEVSGTVNQLVPSISPGYGFTAIIVAFLGRLHPAGILAAGLLMALSYLGGETAQIEMGLPAAVTGVFQGMLLFFLLGADVLIHYRVVWASAGAAKAVRS